MPGCHAHQPRSLHWPLHFEVSLTVFALRAMNSPYSSNMLTITFAMRTDTTSDPLITRILSMAMEFNDLTGTSPSDLVFAVHF